jgi:hypothetical protein
MILLENNNKAVEAKKKYCNIKFIYKQEFFFYYFCFCERFSDEKKKNLNMRE